MKFINPANNRSALLSPSMRREWIEIRMPLIDGKFTFESPSMRREWIEIFCLRSKIERNDVSLHAEGVD